ncbi:MAG: helix-turn-helix domain-containing protein [Polyangiaceae bacterium]|nr:helix-turn-helix domain-containing protein [Polyangiaceae bacterium]
MIERTPNRVREHREARSLSQITLAERAGLSRQSVGAIEAGRATPAVDVALRIARALDCSVEDLFADVGEAAVGTEASEAAISGRVAVAHIAGRWVSYALRGISTRVSADGVAAQSGGGQLDVEPLRPLAEARENIVIMGCAMGLGLVADRLNSRPGPGRFLWFPRSSTAALEALARAHAHVAGVHLVDARTGDANVEDVRRHTQGAAVVLITLARWEAGLVTAPGNPKRVKRPGDLARRGLRIVTREEGSGARRLLDRHLREAGVSREARSARRGTLRPRGAPRIDGGHAATAPLRRHDLGGDAPRAYVARLRRAVLRRPRRAPPRRLIFKEQTMSFHMRRLLAVMAAAALLLVGCGDDEQPSPDAGILNIEGDPNGLIGAS